MSSEHIDPPSGSEPFAAQQLLDFVLSIERENEIKDGANTRIAEHYDAAKSAGFDKKVIKAVVAKRAETPDKKEAREETETLVSVYLDALRDAEASRVRVPLREAAE